MKKTNHKNSLSPAALLLIPLVVPIALPLRCVASELQAFSDDMLEFILQTDTETLQAIEYRPMLDTVGGSGVQEAHNSDELLNAGEGAGIAKDKIHEARDGVRAKAAEMVQ